MRNTAKSWLKRNGLTRGTRWWVKTLDGEMWALEDALETTDATHQRVWLGESAADATPADAYVWPDDSAVILTADGWEVADMAQEPLARSEVGGVFTDAEMDRHAASSAPSGWTIRRGGYLGTTDNRADRWYIDREESDAWDRRGPGYATIQAAVDEARRLGATNVT